MAKAESKPRKAGTAKRGAAIATVAQPGRLLALAAVGASLVLSALLTLDLLRLGPAYLGGRLPAVGEIADRSYKAPADVTLSDAAATQELQRAAVAEAPAVYDFDERRAMALRERVRRAFAEARAAEAERAAEAGGEATTEPAAEGDPTPDPAASFRDALGTPAPIPPAALRVLAGRAFVEEDERALRALLADVVSRMIVDDRAEFRLDNRPVVVRDLGSGHERRLQNLDAVLDVEAARVAVSTAAERILAKRPLAEREALRGLASLLVRPNLTANLRATEERRQAAEASVKAVTITLRKGEIIVRDGDPITARHAFILQGIREQYRAASQFEVFLGVAGVVCVLLFVLWRFASRGIQRFAQEPKDALFLLSVLVATALGTRVALFFCGAIGERPEVAPFLPHSAEPFYYLIPVAAGTMLVRMVHSAETSALFAVVTAILAGLQVGGEVEYAVYALVGSLVAARGVARVSQRGTLLRAGLGVGAANAIVVAFLVLLDGHERALAPALIATASGFVAGGLSGVLVSGLAPVVETLFAYTTDVKLLELANREQPLLRELEFRAPGTYHHSMMVGHLAEKAAEAIGANALLARVAGYYHDIGKMRRPHFFVENFTIHRGENRHEKLAPPMSARIIQAHVKDGLDYGKRYKLAPPIMNGIAQHHGTSIIRFFFEKAKETADPEKGKAIAEHDYRYGGPRPQNREAGILMLADSVEAASRTLADATPARIQQLVQRLINNYFRDGQLDECSLTLRDLHAIARSFIDTLSAIRHERIDYPPPTDAEGRRLDEGTDEGVVERLEPKTKDRPERPAARRQDDIRRLGLP